MSTADLSVAELIELADAWQDLGWAVQSQARDVLEGGNPADKNPEALRRVADWLTMADKVGVPHAFDLAADFQGVEP